VTKFSSMIFAETPVSLSAKKQAAARDNLLDVAKGLAIILVVLGHTYQGQTEEFDELAGFRTIYAFHMPLFAFLAGAAAIYWIDKFDANLTMVDAASACCRRIGRSAVCLLLPFLSWTAINYLMGRAEGSLWNYAVNVFQHTDVSLWFLPCIFWCTVYVALYLLLATAIGLSTKNTRLETYVARLRPMPVQMVLLILLWSILKGKLPSQFGLIFANGFHGGLFLFFAIGIASYRNFIGVRKLWLRAIPYLVFLSLVPFWHRTLPSNLVTDAPWVLSLHLVAKNYAFIVAISGTLAAVDIARTITALKLRVLNAFFGYLGSISLAIYAIHFYMLAYWPPLIAPIAYSAAVSFLVSQLPGVRIALLGK